MTSAPLEPSTADAGKPTHAPEQSTTPVDAKVLDARRKQRLVDKSYVTGRVGETCRFIGFGVLAIFYAILTSDKPFAADIIARHRIELYLTGGSAAVTILADYIQYLAGAWAVDKALGRKESYLYNDGWISYRLRAICYWIKQISAFIASAGVVYLVYVQFMR